MQVNIPDAPVTRRGFVLILSSPSGAGKSTLTRRLLQRHDLQMQMSVSVTTRARRPSEIAGQDYHFITREEFEVGRDRGDYLEWAEVHGNFYGTPRGAVEKSLVAGHDMVFDIDWQGADQVVEKMPDDVVTVFILPPSMAELRNRLVRRAEDAKEVIDARLAAARDEIAHWEAYDYVVVNEDLDLSYNALIAIISAERLKRRRQTALVPLVASLMDGPLPQHD
ncbi:guanylate kinase [Camelimonas sp. ID_303_24]